MTGKTNASALKKLVQATYPKGPSFDIHTPLTRRVYPNGPIVIMLANEGGGTRKTTDGVNLGVALAREGFKVGIADADQTMAASSYLGYGVTNKKYYPQRVEHVYAQLAQMPNINQVLLKKGIALKDALLPARTRTTPVTLDQDGKHIDDPAAWDKDTCFTTIPNLFLVLGSREMSQASDLIRRGLQADDYWLRRAVNALPEGTLDFLLVDSRGTFDTLELSLLNGVDYVIGCVKPDNKDDDTLDGLKALIKLGHETFEFAGGSADLRYLLFNGHVLNRGKFYKDMFDEMMAFYGPMMLPYVSECVQVAESVRAQEPAHFWLVGEDRRVVDQFKCAAKIIARDLAA